MIFLVCAFVVVLAVWLLIIAVGMSPVLLPMALMTATTAAPGVVPAQAAMPIFGPVQGEDVALMQAIMPWYGTRYALGGNGPPLQGVIDCSGFTVAVFRRLGYDLPRTAQQQFNATQRVEQPEVRDLIFFGGTYDTGRGEWISHVGIYIGGGMMVSAIAPTLGRQSIGDPYWRAHFAGFGRIRRT